MSIILLYFSSFVPGVEMTLFALASFFVGFTILETGIKGGFVYYIALVLLTFFIIPNQAAVLPFLVFFGLYGILKYLIEKMRNGPVEIILKLVYFNISIAVIFYLFKAIFIGQLNLPDFPWYALLLIANIFFFFYDYIYTLAIGFYRAKIQKLKNLY